jgi:hypothetical protein
MACSTNEAYLLLFSKLSLKTGPAAYCPERPMVQKIWYFIKNKICFITDLQYDFYLTLSHFKDENIFIFLSTKHFHQKKKRKKKKSTICF